MIKPSNPIRRNIINKLFSWQPTREWESDPIKDAQILVYECQKLLPYLVVLHHRMANPVMLRNKDYIFDDCLLGSLEPLALSIRKWIFSCPSLQATGSSHYYDAAGNTVFI